jgi:hypothetical protein
LALESAGYDYSAGSDLWTLRNAGVDSHLWYWIRLYSLSYNSGAETLSVLINLY